MREIKLNKKYYLLDNGLWLYRPKGIDIHFLKTEIDDDEKYVQIAMINGAKCEWVGIVCSTDKLYDLDTEAFEYYQNNPQLTNEFYKAVTGKKHTFPYQKWGEYMPLERIKELEMLNKARLVNQMISEEIDGDTCTIIK